MSRRGALAGLGYRTKKLWPTIRHGLFLTAPIFLTALIVRLLASPDQVLGDVSPEWVSSVLRVASEAIMVAAVVELLALFIMYRSFFVQIMQEGLREVLLMENSYLESLGTSAVKDVRKRCTQQLIGCALPEHDSLYELVSSKMDELLLLPFAGNTRIHRDYVLAESADRPVWRVVTSQLIRYENEMDHDVKLPIGTWTECRKDPGGPMPTVKVHLLRINGVEQDVRLEREDKGGFVIYRWDFDLDVPARGSASVYREDARVLEVDDFWEYQPQIPLRQAYITARFDTLVYPAFSFTGYAEDECFTPAKGDFCRLDMDGWMLPQHSVRLSWDVSGLLNGSIASARPAQSIEDVRQSR
jgi:hypothetical protein